VDELDIDGGVETRVDDGPGQTALGEVADTGDAAFWLADTGLDIGPEALHDTGVECVRLQGTGCGGLAGVPVDDCTEFALEELDDGGANATVEGGGCTCAVSAPPGWWLLAIALVVLGRRWR
jgi:MYXO-CTERM domain-containing protein